MKRPSNQQLYLFARKGCKILRLGEGVNFIFYSKATALDILKFQYPQSGSDGCGLWIKDLIVKM